MPSRTPPPESNDGRGAELRRGAAALPWTRALAHAAAGDRRGDRLSFHAGGWSAVTASAVPEGTSPGLAAAATGCLKLGVELEAGSESVEGEMLESSHVAQTSRHAQAAPQRAFLEVSEEDVAE